VPDPSRFADILEKSISMTVQVSLDTTVEFDGLCHSSRHYLILNNEILCLMPEPRDLKTGSEEIQILGEPFASIYQYVLSGMSELSNGSE
jgi:hypothetical protein